MMNLTVVELKEMAKKQGLKGYSKLKKAELVELLEGNKQEVKEVKEEVSTCATSCKASNGCDSSQGCPMILAMMKEAGFSNGQPMKAGGKFNTPELRKENIKNKMKEASKRVKIDENTIPAIKEGNAKLKGIFNFALPPFITCPYATRNCMMKCYGFKQYYPNVADNHYKNLELTKMENFVEIMFKQLVILSASIKAQNEMFGTNKKITFRIHTVGDFYSQEYFNKWMEIVELCEIHNLPIQFGAYTKSVVFIKNYLKRTGKKLKDLNINFMFSAWNDTEEKFLKMAEELEMNVYAVTNKNFELLENVGFEKCADNIIEGACGVSCFKCYDKEEKGNKQIDGTIRKLIAIEMH